MRVHSRQALSVEVKLRRLKVATEVSARETLREIRDGKDRFLYEHKMNHPCPCGMADPRCLDFHHLDRATKLFNIGEHSGWSLEDVIEEGAKCIVLCANCHRKSEITAWAPKTYEELWAGVSGGKRGPFDMGLVLSSEI